MNVTLILGAQGTGKSVFAESKFKSWNKRGQIIYSANPSRQSVTGELVSLLNAEKKPHNLLIDEADVYFSCLNTRQRNILREYWALARHKGLNEALFIARRYIQIPIFIRVSANSIYVNNSLKGTELKRINEDTATECWIAEIKELKQWHFLDILSS